MFKKFSAFLILLLFTGNCGFTPIYSKKNINISIEELNLTGDRTINNTWAVGTGDNTRFIMGGRYPASNVIDSVTIASTGNAVDHGDLVAGKQNLAQASNGHGGL